MELSGWGRCVMVRAVEDLAAVDEFIAERGEFRRAVVFQNLTVSERSELITSIEQLGVDLRRFTPSDKAEMRIPVPGARARASMLAVSVLGTPLTLAMRLLGRRNSMYELIDRPPDALGV